MLKRRITYKNFDDVMVEKDFYFNLSKSEIIEMELQTEGGFGDNLQQIVLAKDVPKLMAAFKDLILRGYGEKSADGDEFIKSPEISHRFSQTAAYQSLFLEFFEDTNNVLEFIAGMMPSDMGAELRAQMAKPVQMTSAVKNTEISNVFQPPPPPQ